MKITTKGPLAFALGMLVATAGFAYSANYTPGAGINGTPHDIPRVDTGMAYMPVTTPADSLNRICIYCHAPHNTFKLSSVNNGPGVGVGSGEEAPDQYDYLPLWNHAFSTNFVFQMYQNGPGAPATGPHASQAIEEFNALGTTSPHGSSMLCLSCHDGSVAVNTYGVAGWQPGASVSNGASTIANGYVIGKDAYLGNHHPVSFSYDNALAVDNELRDPSTALTPTTTVRDHLYGAAQDQLECGSCHSVHNKGNDGESLLWRSDSRSELCLTCHDKGEYTTP